MKNFMLLSATLCLLLFLDHLRLECVWLKRTCFPALPPLFQLLLIALVNIDEPLDLVSIAPFFKRFVIWVSPIIIE